MKKIRLIALLSYPTLFWFILFLLTPLCLVAITSFLTRQTYGGIDFIFTIKNYQSVLRPVYLAIFFKSVLMAAITAMVCITLGFMMAWAMATSSSRMRSFWLIALMLPFFTNLVIRIYAIKLFVGVDGPIQQILSFLHISFDPYLFTANPYLVLYGLITCYLPFAVFPIYAAFEKFDFSLIEAAMDLGARPVQIMFKILIPNLRVALVNAFSLVFVPCVGEYVIPDLLGGAKQVFMGNLITEQFLKSRNWPVGSAISIILFLILIFFFLLMNKLKGAAHERKI
jgi:spermidine/putrescine transport system permease protein